jgi:hypothetical protein
MRKPARAFITFYDEQTQTLKVCTVPKASIQSSIDRALVLDVAPERPDEKVTDEHARQLGGLAIHMLAAAIPELQARIQITTKEPIDWSPIPEPGS